MQVQPDAAPEVIKASYRALMQKLKFHPDLGGDQWNAVVVNEAYSVLSNPVRRAAYDAEQGVQMMGGGAGNRASSDGYHDTDAANTDWGGTDADAAQPHSTPAFESMLCVLCHQLTTVASAMPGPARCRVCRSPLMRVDAARAEDPGKRALPRLERSAPVRYLRTYRDGSTQVCQAELENLSPQGMRLSTEHALSIGEVLRVECQLLTAVARVVVSRVSGDLRAHHIVGIEFITVDFIRQQGSLFASQA